MPLQSEEVLARLVEATGEAKSTIRELHEARAAAIDVIKRHRKEIADAVVAEVDRAVAELSGDARAALVAGVEQTIQAITTDWRAALGLD